MKAFLTFIIIFLMKSIVLTSEATKQGESTKRSSLSKRIELKIKVKRSKKIFFEHPELF
ncbi:MAG: hypothetical protein ABIP51_01020 [Bacteroidia bacterium]